MCPGQPAAAFALLMLPDPRMRGYVLPKSECFYMVRTEPRSARPHIAVYVQAEFDHATLSCQKHKEIYLLMLKPMSTPITRPIPPEMAAQARARF